VPEITVNGVRTYYEEDGSGPAVVLVHGLGGSTALWAKVLPGLSVGHRVVTYDLRGSGRSARPDGPYSLDDLVADLDGVIDALGLAPAAVVGHSMSGAIVLAYAARHPEKVRAVVGVGAVTELPDAGRDGMRQRAATVRAEGRTSWSPVNNGVAPSWRR
jgi:aminoacrylate hydrolase